MRAARKILHIVGSWISKFSIIDHFLKPLSRLHTVVLPFPRFDEIDNYLDFVTKQVTRLRAQSPNRRTVVLLFASQPSSTWLARQTLLQLPYRWHSLRCFQCPKTCHIYKVERPIICFWIKFISYYKSSMIIDCDFYGWFMWIVTFFSYYYYYYYYYFY